MNKLLEKAYKSGLMDVTTEWIKEHKYVSISSIQRSFSISFSLANTIFEELIKNNLVEKESTYKRGNKVITYNPLVNIKVYLLDINNNFTDALKKEFKPYEEVEVVNDDFTHFMDTHKDIKCIVSPANSFGYMDGGYDVAITDYFGNEVQKEVRKYIDKHLFGEQPIATSIMLNIPNTDKKLIHTPTMRLPSPIKDPFIVYQCMRTTMMMVISNNIKSVVIPAFGGLTGRLSPKIVAKYMVEGYRQIKEFMEVR